MQLDDIFSQLWQQYITDSPEVAKIYQLFVDRGEMVINDHIALRTFDDPRVNVDKLGQFFIDLGYQAKGNYFFKVKKLTAKHYEHKTDPTQPKIFISQLLTQECGTELQTVAKQCIDTLPKTLLSSPELLIAGAHWQPLDYSIYQNLAQASAYAAWLYAFGFRANHFTINVNALKTLGSLQEVNALLLEKGFALNTSGGVIKGSPQDLLEQSATLANTVELTFRQGIKSIPNSYYEFAKRYPDKKGVLYQGFITTSADKIFESTNAK